MIQLSDNLEIWFATGSQHLYGEDVLRQVDANSQTIVEGLDASPHLPIKIVFKSVLTGPDAIRQLAEEANSSPRCVGLVLWMHTFSPAKMWIGGLTALRKPFLHLHTQFGRDLPWKSIDMDFMNLNQSAHGDREFGFITTRLRLEPAIVVGHWAAESVQRQIGDWIRAARAWHDWQGAKFARIGDNMRQVAVTEGDKVSAEMRFGFSVNTYGVGDVVAFVDGVGDKPLDDLVAEYEDRYTMTDDLRRDGSRHASVRDAARIELGLRAFLESGGFKGFTDTFEDLHGLKQLPGIAVQRLMADGYGFGGEGDWKTSALVRALKVIAADRPEGVSFMEDYTYHLEPGNEMVLGAHMLEICESIADGKPSLEVHPLGIGGKADPARLVFNSPAGSALNASLIDLGNRFRLIANAVDAIATPEPLPNLPVARVLWKPLPDFQTACAAWIMAGGAHHTAYSRAVTTEHLEHFANIAGIELVTIDADTKLNQLRRELKWNEAFHQLAPGSRGI